MKYVIVPDTHFGNEKLEECRFKGFSDKVMKNIRSSIPKDGVLVHIGDICYDDDAMWNTKLTEMPFKRKILVRGNHDKKSDTWYMSNGWDFVCESFSIVHFNKNILFSHKPMPDSGYDINIHGHFHAFSKEIIQTREPEIFSILNDKHYLVSLERTDYKPVQLEGIICDFTGDLSVGYEGNNTLKMLERI